jgi:hypothetical protein
VKGVRKRDQWEGNRDVAPAMNNGKPGECEMINMLTYTMKVNFSSKKHTKG